MATLIERVLEVRDQRAWLAAAAALLMARRKQFDLENADLIQRVRDSAAAVDSAEVALRAVATEEYDRTKDRKPAPGVEIKLFKENAIDEEQAMLWAVSKELCLIPAKLDIAAIKKLATVQPLPFVQVTEVPKVQIATDLSKVELPDSAAPASAVA